MTHAPCSAFSFRSQRGFIVAVLALCTAACGGEDEPLVGGGTEAGSSDGGSEGDGPTPSDDTGDSTSGGTQADGSDGPEGSDSGSEESGTTGEPDDEGSPYRIVFTEVDEGSVVRLYSATPDLTQIDELTPDGSASVELGWAAGPRSHPRGRFLAFTRGQSGHVADVFTTIVEPIATSSAIVNVQWNPVEPELAVLTDDAQLTRIGADATDLGLIADLSGDAEAPEDIVWSWNPLGDRIVVSSKPDGNPNERLWMVDADGTNVSTVGDAISGAFSGLRWLPDGESVVFRADLTPEFTGAELWHGDRDSLDIICDAGADVSRTAYSPDASRVAYLGPLGLFSANTDGTDRTLVEGAAVDGPTTRIAVSGDGMWAARASGGSLTVTPTTLHNPVEIDSSGVNARSIAFEPGGPRLAYLDEDPPILRRVDGDGVNEANHALTQGQGVIDFQWAWGGLLYSVADENEKFNGLYHTSLGDTPLFQDSADDFTLVPTLSADERFLVVQSFDADGNGRHMCVYDTAADPDEGDVVFCRASSAMAEARWLTVVQDDTL